MTEYAPANASVSDQLIRQNSSLDPAVAKSPIQVTEHVVVGERVAQTRLEQVAAQIQNQTYFIPLILFIVITFAAQLVATSIASEKENKTLETLLSAPVRRQSIVIAKLLAAGILALIFAGVYMIGFRSYVEGLTGTVGGQTAGSAAISELGLAFSAGEFAVLGATLFLGILIALALSLILGAFAEDVKGIQATITPLMVMLLIPYLLTTFFSVDQVSPILKWVIYAIPFSHSFLAPQNLVFHEYATLGYGILYQVIIFGVLVWVAGRIFATDAIVTMKLNFGKRKGI